MKVLHVCAGNLYGGLETYLVTLAKLRYLCPEMEPEFAVCFHGRLWDELAETGVALRELGPVRASRPWTVLRARSRLRSVLAAGRYDIVICQMAWTLGLFGGTVRRAGCVAVVHVHGARGGGWVDWLAARQRPAVVICAGQNTAATWQPSFPNVRCEVLHNPLPAQLLEAPELSPADRAALRAKLGAEPDDVVILQASRIEPLKGQDRTIAALARLKHVPNWRLWLAGGVQRAEEQAFDNKVRAMAVEGGVADHVSFLGQRPDVPDLMRAADLYCQGNRGPEGFSLSFVEASYSRLPIVTTNFGGAPEMIDSTHGILVPPGEDVTELAEALHRLITDAGTRAAMGAKAREKAVRLCDPTQQLNRLHGILQQAKGRDR